VLYTSGAGPPEAVLALVARARGMRSPVLAIVDDADRASADTRAALRALGPAIADAPVLVLAAGQGAAGPARLEPSEAVVLEPLDADSVRAITRFYASDGDAAVIPVDTLLAATHGIPRRVHEARDREQEGSTESGLPPGPRAGIVAS
jgi:hypothetical protein